MSETDEHRALRILAKGSAHEMVARPIRILDYLVKLGYANRRPYMGSYKNGRPLPSWETTITARGLEALANDPSAA